MRKHNASNERIKRKYLIFLREAKRQNDASLDAVAKALARFDDYNHQRDFKYFHFEQAVGFKKHLAKQDNAQTGKPLSKATLHSTLRHLRSFFQWLSMQPGYKSRIIYTDAEYFNLSEKETRIATASRERPVPTIDQIRHVLGSMSDCTIIARRNRALIAFTLLTGCRDSAIASMKLKHVDLVANCVFQDAREVNTKFSKTFTTVFFPVGKEIRQYVSDWIDYLTGTLLFGNDDPLFPRTQVVVGEARVFAAEGVIPEHWTTASPIRRIFREAFENAGLPYFNPHSFRNTLAGLGERLCQTPEEFKAWSQNLGHEKVLTTFFSYGEVQPTRQAEIIGSLGECKSGPGLDEDKIAEAVFRKITEQSDALPSAQFHPGVGDTPS